MYDEQTAGELLALETYARIRWGPRPPLTHPDISVTFYCVNAAQDRDGMLTTVLDVLVKARVLTDDNMRHCNGAIVLRPAVIGKEQKTVIELS